MKLTLSVSYGIGVLLQIQEHGDGGPLTAAKIARGCRFPRRFLYRVLHKLVQAGLLSGTSGPGGGYALARRPERITLLDIVDGVDSGLEPTVLPAPCARQSPAIGHVNQLCRRSAARFAAELSRVSLADLVARLTPRQSRRARRNRE
jgi:Rrf2 family protein